MKIICFVASLCILSSPIWAQDLPPAGWRFPTESDCTGGWKEFRAGGKTPFHVHADFNEDGLDDDVWILLSLQNKQWGLFLFESQSTGPARVIELEVIDPEKGHGRGQAQSMGVGVAAIGDYRTACGKGYWACTAGEPEILHLIRPGINYFRFESANSFFWWDEKTKAFKRTWISD